VDRDLVRLLRILDNICRHSSSMRLHLNNYNRRCPIKCRLQVFDPRQVLLEDYHHRLLALLEGLRRRRREVVLHRNNRDMCLLDLNSNPLHRLDRMLPSLVRLDLVRRYKVEPRRRIHKLRKGMHLRRREHPRKLNLLSQSTHLATVNIFYPLRDRFILS